MPDPVPDPTRPESTAGWPAQLMYQVRIFFREFGSSQIGMLLVTILLGYIGVQSYQNAGHAEKAITTVKESHAETATKLEAVHETQAANGAKIDLAASAATEVKNTLAVKEAKTDAKIEDLTKQVAALPPAVASEVQKKMK